MKKTAARISGEGRILEVEGGSCLKSTIHKEERVVVIHGGTKGNVGGRGDNLVHRA